MENVYSKAIKRTGVIYFVDVRKARANSATTITISKTATMGKKMLRAGILIDSIDDAEQLAGMILDAIPYALKAEKGEL